MSGPGNPLWARVGLERRTRTALVRARRYVLERPKLRRTIVGVLARLPRLKARLARAVRSGAAAAVDPAVPVELAALSPRERDLYLALRSRSAERPPLDAGKPAAPRHADEVERGPVSPAEVIERVRQIARAGASGTAALPSSPSKRPALAFVSPLPPERSGIAQHSVDLIRALAPHYEIHVIVAQEEVTDRLPVGGGVVRDVAWFLAKAHTFERVIYHFGNSRCHAHMFALLAKAPGIVVLHDFFIGDAYNAVEHLGLARHATARALYRSHGYAPFGAALARQRFNVTSAYPANLEVLRQATGVVVHSQHARSLAAAWYGERVASELSVFPLLRRPCAPRDRAEARRQLGLAADDFMVASFGFLGETKLNLLLVEAFRRSALARDPRCSLVFVGEEPLGEYGAALARAIHESGLGRRVRILGWSDSATFEAHLDAADLAVQLRTKSRGETSAAALDCLNHGLATIVNAHGSFAELPRDAVCMLPDACTAHDLTRAIEALWRDPDRRAELGARARAHVAIGHSPEVCAKRYLEQIEAVASRCSVSDRGLVRALERLDGPIPTETEARALARAIADSFPSPTAPRQFLIDVSATCNSDRRTGIERVVRALLVALVREPPSGYRVEPVYLSTVGGEIHYRYARTWGSSWLGGPSGALSDEPVECAAGDLLLIADLMTGHVQAADRVGLYDRLRERGVEIDVIIYDLLPVLRPEFFPPHAFEFGAWLKIVTRFAKRALCISAAVAADLRAWLATEKPERIAPLHIDWFHLGADLEASLPSKGLPRRASAMLARFDRAPTFLMVGTIEPRKGHLQALAAFSRLWERGHDVHLVIVGKSGWDDLPADQRRTIPHVLKCLKQHPERGRRLHWFADVSDEFLAQIYRRSACLLAPSEGEGFGLPLIEAAQRGLALLVRDIPVFREVAREHATYFRGLEPEALAQAVLGWLQRRARGEVLSAAGLSWLTWRQSAHLLLDRLELTPGPEWGVVEPASPVSAAQRRAELRAPLVRRRIEPSTAPGSAE